MACVSCSSFRNHRTPSIPKPNVTPAAIDKTLDQMKSDLQLVNSLEVYKLHNYLKSQIPSNMQKPLNTTMSVSRTPQRDKLAKKMSEALTAYATNKNSNMLCQDSSEKDLVDSGSLRLEWTCSIDSQDSRLSMTFSINDGYGILDTWISLERKDPTVLPLQLLHSYCKIPRAMRKSTEFYSGSFCNGCSISIRSHDFHASCF